VIIADSFDTDASQEGEGLARRLAVRRLLIVEGAARVVNLEKMTPASRPSQTSFWGSSAGAASARIMAYLPRFKRCGAIRSLPGRNEILSRVARKKRSHLKIIVDRKP